MKKYFLPIVCFVFINSIVHAQDVNNSQKNNLTFLKFLPSSTSAVKKGVRALAWFVLVGWAIYPIGYMCMDGGWLSSVFEPKQLDLWYNIADAVNKTGFGLVVYNIAITESKK